VVLKKFLPLSARSDEGKAIFSPYVLFAYFACTIIVSLFANSLCQIGRIESNLCVIKVSDVFECPFSGICL